MLKCEKCGKTTKPHESTALLYEYKPNGDIASQKKVCLGCYKAHRAKEELEPEED